MHKVKCLYCGQVFDRDKQPFVQVSARRYAHYTCAISEDEQKAQEEKDKDALYDYIKKLFNTTCIDVRIHKQIKQFKEEYNYSYSGIRKALIYFYEVKGNSIEKANGGIGIVPHIYKRAYDYYFALWQAQQKNEDKIVEAYVPRVREVRIKRPVRKVRKENLFSFLDEEEEV